MSLIISSASRLKPEVRLSQAISEFEAGLSAEQKVIFRAHRIQACNRPPNANDVMEITAQIDRDTSTKSRRCFGPRLTAFLQSAQQYAAALDVVVGGSQNLIACGVWSLVRITLLSFVAFSSYLDSISELLMIIGRSAPRYQKLALIYSQSPTLQSSLSEYFIVIVRLCQRISNFTQQSTWKQFTSPMFDSTFKSHRAELERLGNDMRDEVALLTTQIFKDESEANGRFRHFTSNFIESRQRRQEEKTKQMVLDACSSFDHDTTWKQLKKVGMSTHHRNNQKYDDWMRSTGSCTLLWEGKLGAGKSVLLANVVDDLNLLLKNDSQVLFFFCRHDIAESLRARTIFGSLARQLLQNLPTITNLEQNFHGGSISTRDTDSVLSILDCDEVRKSRAYLVIDGLDECEDADGRHLIELLRTLQGLMELHICISYRTGTNTAFKESLESLRDISKSSIPEDHADLSNFIDNELERRIDSGLLQLGDQILVLEIHDALTKGSQGMFLWAALQIEILCTLHTDDDIREALEDLPKDLSETFERILHKSEKYGKHYQLRSLQLLIVTRRPLTTLEIREALSVVIGDNEWNPKRQINDLSKVLASCGCLVTVDEEELTVHLVHSSIRQFLVAKWLSRDRAEVEASGITVTYLNYGILETQVSTRVVPPMPGASAPSTVIQSLQTPKAARNLALRLLKSKRFGNIDIGKTLAEASQRIGQGSVQHFHFAQYAKDFWLAHLLNSPAPESGSTLDTFLQNVIAVSLLKSKERSNDASELLKWAASQSCVAVLKLFLDDPQGITMVKPLYATLLENAIACRDLPAIALMTRFRQRFAPITPKTQSHLVLLATEQCDTSLLDELLSDATTNAQATEGSIILRQYAESALRRCAARSLHNREEVIAKELSYLLNVQLCTQILQNRRDDWLTFETVLDLMATIAVKLGDKDLLALILDAEESDTWKARIPEVTVPKCVCSYVQGVGRETVLQLITHLWDSTQIHGLDFIIPIRGPHASVLYSVLGNHANILELLMRHLQYGPSFSSSADLFLDNGDTALTAAVKESSYDIVTLLLNVFDPRNANRFGLTPLYIARQRDDYTMIHLLETWFVQNERRLREAGPGATNTVEDLIRRAAHAGEEDLLTIADDMIINRKDSKGLSPLLVAFNQRRSIKTLERLIAHGANPDAKFLTINGSPITLIQEAARGGRWSVVRIVAKAGADISGEQGLELFNLAKRFKQFETLLVLIECKVGSGYAPAEQIISTQEEHIRAEVIRLREEAPRRNPSGPKE